MRVSLVCVGRTKVGAERTLAERYFERAKTAGRAAGLVFDFRELPESKARRRDDRQRTEAAAILAVIGADARLLALDEAGHAIGSEAFAAMLGAARDEGTAALAVVVGGPDGLAPALRQNAYRALSFGAMTWPHQLVRVMASEQLYRAVTILNGHPYHRI